MSIVLLFLGCFVLYGKSKFFPDYLTSIGNIIGGKKQLFNFIGYIFLSSSYVLFSLKFGWGTGFVLFLISISLVYTVLLLVLSLHNKYLYFIAVLSISIIIIENIL